MGGRSVFLIEAQLLFVPALANVFEEAGLELRGASGDADARLLLEAQPDVLFIDTDYVQQDPAQLIEFLRSLLPRSEICIYADTTTWLQGKRPASVSVFSKDADRQQIVAALRSALLRSA